MTKCSTMESCYDEETSSYENDRCLHPKEKCAYWIAAVSGKIKKLQGCLQSTFCDKTGYWKKGQGVFYKCHDETIHGKETVVVKKDG